MQPNQAAPTLTQVATKPPRVNNRLISLGIGIAVVLILAGVGYIHSQSAPDTVKTFYNDFFSYKFDAAYNLICPAKQSSVKPSFDTLKGQFQQFQDKVTFDTSKLSFDVKQSGLTSATIHVHGSVTVAGGSVSEPVNVDEDDPVALNGINWCVNFDSFGTSS
jgi:hypothetical protein